MPHRDAIVVGAGLSGLATAWYLTEAGATVRVIEATPAIGGLIRTSRRQEGIVETAARSFIWTPRVQSLFSSAGITPMFARDQSKRRFIFRKSQPRRWPLGPIETIGAGIHLASAALTGRLKPRGTETVEAWARRVAGRPGLRWVIAPALQGIYASTPDQLSARAVFGGARTRGRMAAPPQGMAELFDRLRARLLDRGATFEHNVRVDTIDAINPARVPIAICTSAPAAAPLIAPHAPRLAASIARVRMTSLLPVTAFYPESRDDASGFGVLFPRESGVQALGVIFNSDMFDDRSQLRSETWIYGDPSSAKLVPIQQSAPTVIRRDRRLFKNRDQEPVALYPAPSIAQLPIYNEVILEIADRVADLPPWLGLTGNYLGKMGVSAIVEQAAATAERLMSAK